MAKIGINARHMLKNSMEGIGNYTFEIVSRLAEIMPESTFYLLFDRKPFPTQLENLKNVEICILSPPARHPILWHYWYEYAIPRWVKQNDIDLFFSPDGFCSQRLQIPQIMVVHDIAFWHFKEHLPKIQSLYLRKHFPIFLEKADKIVTVSHFTQKDLVKHFGFVESKTSVIYNGYRKVNPSPQSNILEKLSIQTNSYFLHFGSIHPRKNIIQMLEGFKLFKENTQNNLKLIICGRWAWKNKALKSYLKTYPLSKEVIFTGYLPDEDAFALLKNSNSFIYPSLWEGFGLPLLEAMQYQIPIICSNTTSIPEVAGDAACYFNPNESKDIADAMDTIVNNQEVRAKIIHSAPTQLELFSWGEAALALKVLIVQSLENPK